MSDRATLYANYADNIYHLITGAMSQDFVTAAVLMSDVNAGPINFGSTTNTTAASTTAIWFDGTNFVVDVSQIASATVEINGGGNGVLDMDSGLLTFYSSVPAGGGGFAGGLPAIGSPYFQAMVLLGGMYVVDYFTTGQTTIGLIDTTGSIASTIYQDGTYGTLYLLSYSTRVVVGNSDDMTHLLQVNGSMAGNSLTLTGLPSGTLLSPPAGLAIGDVWEDTTTSTQYPILRIRAT